MTDDDDSGRIGRLSAASVRRVIEPDHDVLGGFGDGPVTGPELLSVAGLGLDLSPDQLAVLAREELASVTEASIRFEAGLMTGFTREIATGPGVTDPRVVYVLHEVGEETRHSRLFIRMIRQLGPRARNPLHHPLIRRLQDLVLPSLTGRPALLLALVLAGEEVTDLLQKRAYEDPASDPYLVEVIRYHRQEEARHLVFNRAILRERWAVASWHDRLAVRYLAPVVVGAIFRSLVHPGVYAEVGLPAWRTWWAAHRTPERLALRHEAIRPVVEAMTDAGVFRPGRVPRPWRTLAGLSPPAGPARRAAAAGAVP